MPDLAVYLGDRASDPADWMSSPLLPQTVGEPGSWVVPDHDHEEGSLALGFQSVVADIMDFGFPRGYLIGGEVGQV